MIVNKSMFPLQTGFGVISKMQSRFSDLQMQLGTGMKASTLADMGRDLPMSLSVRNERASRVHAGSAFLAARMKGVSSSNPMSECSSRSAGVRGAPRCAK